MRYRLAAESSRARARLQSEGLNTVLLAMGTTLNIPDPDGRKAMWLPSQVARFLGMYVDAAQQRFVLPEDKKRDILLTAASVLESSAVSNRQLARLAGKMIAAAPAVHLSPLWARAIYKAMRSDLDWDMIYPSLLAMKADIRCYTAILSASQGSSWWKRARALLVAGDASDYAFAAYTPDGEFSHPMVITFTDAELQLLANNQYSSTLREILCILHLVKVLLEVQPDCICHKRLRYETDSQAGWFSVMGMKGNDSTFPVVKELLLLCAQHDVELETVWRPRDDAHQQIADFWSKVEDTSDYRLNDSVYNLLISDPILQGHTPVLDAFANSTNTKVPEAFYSRFYCPGSKGIDALLHPWTAAEGSGLVYIYGPFALMGAIIGKVAKERVNCILVGPNWPRPWRTVLYGLPIRKAVTLPYRDDLLLPGPHLPRNRARSKHPSFEVMAWYILW